MLLSKSQICTSPRYGFELSADAQRIAITLSHTFARSIFSAKNKFCLKKLSLRFHYAIFNVRCFSVCNFLRTESKISYRISVTRTLFELRSDNFCCQLLFLGKLRLTLFIRQVPVDSLKPDLFAKTFNFGQMLKVNSNNFNGFDLGLA